MKRTSPLILVAAIVISALVFLICVAGIVGAWVLNGSSSNTAMGMLGGLEKATQASRASIQSLSDQIAVMQGLMTGLETSVTQAGQKISDPQQVALLLPQSQDHELVETAQNIQDAVRNLNSFTTGVRDLYRAIDRLPFLRLPRLDTTHVQNAAAKVGELPTTVSDLNTHLGEIRSGMKESVKSTSKSIIAINGLLFEINTEGIQMDNQLSKFQAGTAQAKSIIPSLFIFGSILVSIFLLWMALSQVVVMRHAWSILQQPISLIDDDEPDLFVEQSLTSLPPAQADPELKPDLENGQESGK